MKKLSILFLFSILIMGCSKKEEEPKDIVIEKTNIEETFQDNSEIEINENEEVAVEEDNIEVTFKTMYVSSQKGLNIREFASVDSAIIKAIPINTELQVVEGFSVGDWVKIIYEEKECYVNSNYISDTKTEIKTKTKQSNISSSNSNGSYLGNYKITHYCPNSCCGTGNGVTASGATAIPYRTVAMKGISFGTRIVINGSTYVVEDRGVGSGVIDICVNSHQEALNKGVYYADVYIVN